MFASERRFGVEPAERSVTSTAGRVPPHDLDAEAAVLSAVLLSTEAFDQVQVFLAPEHFYSDANRRVYEAVQDLQAKGRPADLVTVATWLRDRNRLQQVGGTPYLAQLADATPSVANVEAHEVTIREKWRVRQLIQTCQRVAAEGYGDYGEVQSFIDGAEQAIFDIARVPTGSAVQPVDLAIKEVFNTLNEVQKRGGGIIGTPTGFTDLDRKCAGLRDGDLYIVAGRPGMGKTALVLNMAVNVAGSQQQEASGDGDLLQINAPVELPGCAVAFFSLEMPREQLAGRLLATEARVDGSIMRSGRPSAQDWTKLTEAAARLTRLPIWLDDTPALGLLELRAKVRRLQADLARDASRRYAARLGLVVIDYLQLMRGRRDAGSREQEISELSRGLKQLAKEMRVPIMALSQLNRSVETRTSKDRRPQLSDLRESGAIEQDADMVVFIYRDDYYRKTGQDRDRAAADAAQGEQGIAELIIAKQRNGPTGVVRLKYTEKHTRFDNLAASDYGMYDDYEDDYESGAEMS